MGRPPKLLLVALAAAALGALLSVGLSSSHSPSIGRVAPALPRGRLAGPPAQAAGRPVLVVFWWLYYVVLWLIPLGTTFSFFMIVRQLVQHGNADQQRMTNTRVFRVAWPIAASVFPIGNDYHLPGLPTSFVLDASGHIRAELRGPQDERSLSRALAMVG